MVIVTIISYFEAVFALVEKKCKRYGCDSMDSPPVLSFPFKIVLNGIKEMDYEK